MSADLMRQTRLALGAVYNPLTSPVTYILSGTSGSTASRLSYQSFSPNGRRELVDQQAGLGGMGTLSHYTPNSRLNRVLVGPEMVLEPTLEEYALLLPWLLNTAGGGSNGSGLSPVAGGTTYALGSVGWRRTLWFDALSRVWTLYGCQVASWTLRGEAGGSVQLEVRAAGVDFDVVTAFPTATGLTYSPRPLVGEAVLVSTAYVDGSSNPIPIRPQSFALSVDHGLNNDRFFASFTSAGPVNTDRRCGLTMALPWRLHDAFWALGAADNGIPLSLGFVIGNRQLRFDMPAVKAELPPVQVGDPELMMPWVGQPLALANTPDSEVAAYLDLTV